VRSPSRIGSSPGTGAASDKAPPSFRAANGELGPDHLDSHERHFAVGDHVLARQPDRNLHPAGEPGAYLRNGARGTIVAVVPGTRPEEDALVVAFDHTGTIELPRSFIDSHQLGAGRHDAGLDHAYAVTGATQPIATSRIDEASSRAETYVDITRGEQANHLYLTRAADPLDGEHLPASHPSPSPPRSPIGSNAPPGRRPPGRPGRANHFDDPQLPLGPPDLDLDLGAVVPGLVAVPRPSGRPRTPR
jgi:hypothetical protein